MLEIKFLGKVKIEYDGENITNKFGAKTKALLSLLVLNKNKPLNREKIVSYLWPDSSEDSGKFNLRFNLWQLRNAIGIDKNGNKFLNTGRSHCGININYTFSCDIIDIKAFEIKEKITIKELEELRNKFSGDFFEGFYFKNCEEFNENIILERSYFEDKKIKILLKLVELYEIEKNFEKCSDILKELANIEPYDEEIALRMIEIYEKSGKRSSAIIFYDNFKKRLMTFLGISPSEELERKYLDLKSKDIRKDKHNIIIEKGKGLNTNEKEIIIETHCIGEVKYYWISNFLDRLTERINIEDYLNKREIKDLGYINVKFITDELLIAPPDVRLINILLKLLEGMNNKNRLMIKIVNIEKIDLISKIFLEEIEKRKLAIIEK
ncbi:MAG: BTAD domain-containing putative transcriptional regulator [Fusobacterium sp.]|uniref:AfsR/SARP family transcriptional regulator n=1 Tax=Fusobacterium sp. TaxID=68766 RepID=UPI0026DD2D38|nr:BTAD domain-containing putative transcriptional regulator [Fusobacterium sp.]MDO4689699.1 BTAD domain-containing putative transcriptional regulator [Fusobacterium sp.]